MNKTIETKIVKLKLFLKVLPMLSGTGRIGWLSDCDLKFETYSEISKKNIVS